jgi:hypothetical protein
MATAVSTIRSGTWKRLDGIDLLRGLAICFVLMNHVNIRLLGAKVLYTKSLPTQIVHFLVWNGLEIRTLGTRQIPPVRAANPCKRKAPASARAFLGCEIQKGASSGCVFSVAGAVGADSFRSSLRIENALICHAVICDFALFFPLPTSFS